MINPGITESGVRPLDSAELLAYECASRNQCKQQKFILLFSAL